MKFNIHKDALMLLTDAKAIHGEICRLKSNGRLNEFRRDRVMVLELKYRVTLALIFQTRQVPMWDGNESMTELFDEAIMLSKALKVKYSPILELKLVKIVFRLRCKDYEAIKRLRAKSSNQIEPV